MVSRHAIASERLLKAAQLRNTDQRLMVMAVFLESGSALAHGELERHIGHQLDRVTLYRTLKTFVDKGLLHSIPDKKEGTKYALCKDECHGHTPGEEHQHQHNHLHFTCRSCNGTYCLENITIPTFNLPAGYRLEEASLVAQGLCDRCA